MKRNVLLRGLSKEFGDAKGEGVGGLCIVPVFLYAVASKKKKKKLVGTSAEAMGNRSRVDRIRESSARSSGLLARSGNEARG